MKNKFLVVLLLTGFLYLVFGCVSNSEKSPLDIALELSGDNRSELEKVLHHYAQKPEDSLKLQSAMFLIKNMPGHYSYCAEDALYVNRYYHEIDSAAHQWQGQDYSIKDQLFRNIKARYTKKLDTIADLRCISAAFLIDNIDQSFNLWQHGAWATHIGFDDFCEYILPYKSDECQTLDNWRTYLNPFCNKDVSKLACFPLVQNSAYHACEMVNAHLKDTMRPRIINEGGISIRRMSTLANIPFGICDDYTQLTVAVMRAKGIPVAIDFTPQWPFRSLGHTWNVLLENTEKNIVFEGANSVPGSPHKKDHRTAKVFRRTFAINKEIQAIHFSEKHIPPTFQDVFMKDVTPEYMASEDMELTSSDPNQQYAYLAVFDNVNWVPIHWAKASKGKFTFRAMGKNTVYLPVYYGANGIVPFGPPILLTAKGVQLTLSADTLVKPSLVLKRKYPFIIGSYEIVERAVGGKIEAADNVWFKNGVTMHVITESGVEVKEVKLDARGKAYRYWRYISPNNSYGNLAELSFYSKDATEPLKGKILGTTGTLNNDSLRTRAAVFDGDALTFFDSPQVDGSWVGLDFGKAVTIYRFIYAPRSDGNNVEIGDEYELVYWTKGVWKSMGRKIADGVDLIYENCPSNALFLLHNHTKGKEERIFTYENGKQIWW